MIAATTPADYEGARGSNAGDQFHELWALLQALRLLKPGDDGLTAVAVEGIGPEWAPIDEDGLPHKWEGVDVSLFYGGGTLESADRIELAQLKYSAANPRGKWTVARLCANTKTSGNNSVIRRLADDFKRARGKAKAGATIVSELISNQEAADDIRNVTQYAVAPPEWPKAERDRHKSEVKMVREASGLNSASFSAFLQALSTDGCGAVSRHAIGLSVVRALTDVLGDDVLSETSQLRSRLRDLMLPEAHRDVIDETYLLSWFGVQAKVGLFPAPALITKVHDPIHRSAADEVARYFNSGEKTVLLHGGGGSGKTTLSQQVVDLLPPGSVQVTFDCFGAGAYMYASDKRHSPDKAFLQLTNDIAVATDCPVFIPRSGKEPATLGIFLSRLNLAAQTLAVRSPDALLLVIVDAADNAVTAATNAQPVERPFVWDLAELARNSLPANVRILLSTRTSRKDSLKFPPNTKEVICDSFTLPESEQHLRRTFPSASGDAATQFHNLTQGNPRVQAYALSSQGLTLDGLFQSLLPNGRTLPDVLEALFNDALEKLGQRHVFEKLIGALAVLPAPASIDAIAAVAECTPGIVSDFALDLRKGLVVADNAMTIADEDFEKYISDRSAGEQAAAIQRAAEHFRASHKVSRYSATHVVAFLIKAGRQKDVFDILNLDPNVDAAADPVTQREIQNSRLSLALASCREAGDLSNELKTVLLGATARRDEGAFYEVLGKEIDLASEFSSSTVYRRVLVDRDRVADQGSALAHFALAAARKKDRTAAIQYLRQYENWMDALKSARNRKTAESWKVTDEDVAALIETTFRVSGAHRAYRELNRWRPIQLRLRVAQIVVPRLILGGFGAELLEALKVRTFRMPFDLAVAVPLQQSGLPVPAGVWTRSFQAVGDHHIPRLDGRGRHQAMEYSWIDTLIAACEIGTWNKTPKKYLRPMLATLERVLTKASTSRVTLSNSVRLDALTRVWLLRQFVDGQEGSADSFVKFVERIGPKEKVPRRKNKHAHGSDDAQSKERSRLRTLHGVYRARLPMLSGQQPLENKKADDSITIPSSAYDFDSGYESIGLRHALAYSVTSLVFLTAVTPRELRLRATAILERRYRPDDEARPDLSVLKPLCLQQTFHSDLISLINTAADEVIGEATRANEKVSTLVEYARFLLPISWPDARELFTQALNIAKDIDEEAVDQIGFVSAIAPVARPDPAEPDPANAHRLATFAAGASLRLYDSDVFDWSDVVAALTTLDPPTALASASRWSDEGLGDLATTMTSLVRTCLARNRISLNVATALAQTGAGLALELVHTLGATLAPNTNECHGVLCEEISRIILTERGQVSRIQYGREFLATLEWKETGYYTRYLQETIRFAPKEREKSENAETPGPPLPVSEPRDAAPPPSYHLEDFIPDATDLSSLIRKAREGGQYIAAAEILDEMARKHVSVANRVHYLDAIPRIDPTVATANEWGAVLERLLDLWSAPSVKGWARQSLPEVISIHLPMLARDLPYREAILDRLLQRCELSLPQQVDVLLKGIARSGSTMDSRVLFALAKRIAPGLAVSQARDVLDWYLMRLEERIPAADRLALRPVETPAGMLPALGRFFFSLFSDIDTRIRWTAAHAVRLLARTGETEIIAEIFRNFERVRDDAFRTPEGEFYWLAARLWSSLVAYRIAVEAPHVLNDAIETLRRAASGEQLAHAAIQEAAKRAILELQVAGVAKLDSAALSGVNVAVRRKKPTKQYRPSPSFDRTRHRNSRRFNFDETDTIPYWYNSLLHIFPDVPQERILEMAERLIIDEWGASSDERYKRPKARKGRFRERDYALTTNNHGSLPTIEEYGTYLEWHAMLSVAAELIRTQPVGALEDGHDRFKEWLRGFLSADPPLWVADLRGPAPLEQHLWNPDPKKDPQWFRPASVDDTLVRSGLVRSDGWIIVGGATEYRSETRQEEISVATSLVSTSTADALVRSYQSASERWDNYLPNETDDPIDWGEFQLVGWLANSHREVQLDEKDGRRYEVRRQELQPGTKVTEHFKLIPKLHEGMIEYMSADTVLMRYRAWDDEPPRESRYSQSSSASSGWRLEVRQDALAEYLATVGQSLVAKILVERRSHKAYSGPYDEPARKKEYWKVITLSSDGKIRDGSRDIAAWKTAGRGARGRGRTRHAASMDASPHRSASQGRRKRDT